MCVYWALHGFSSPESSLIFPVPLIELLHSNFYFKIKEKADEHFALNMFIASNIPKTISYILFFIGI